MRRRVPIVPLVLSTLLGLGGRTALGAGATFQGLGDLPGGASQGFAIGVSADGQAVAGHSQSGSGDEAFLWTPAGGLRGLGDLPGGAFSSFATMASNGGAIVVGFGSVTGGYRPFRWTAAQGMIVLGDLPGGGANGFATGMSADGSVICGQGTSASGTEAFRWTAATGMAGLGDVPGGAFDSSAWGVSADGVAVFGDGTNITNAREAFVWTVAGGLRPLGFLPGGRTFSGAHGASQGGEYVVGASDSAWSGPFGAEAFRWSASGGMVGLGDLPGGAFVSFANGVSDDGRVVVGGSYTAAGTEAMLWTPELGMVNLKSLLLSRGAIAVAGWFLQEAHGISSDGSTITGYGIDPSGFVEPWIAHLALCRDGFADCDGLPENGCETPLGLPGNSATGPPILNCGACFETCSDEASDPRAACTTDLCVPIAGGSAVCRHFDRARCAEARCEGTPRPGADASCQGPDTDADGLPDAWEVPQIQPFTERLQAPGIDLNCDGIVDALNDLVWPDDQRPEVGRKDIYLQVDFMSPSGAADEPESHAPTTEALDRVVDAFGRAGIALHVDPILRSIPHRNVVYFGPDPGGEPLACRGPAEEAVDLYAIKRATFDPRRALGYHYALFAHSASCASPEDCAACPGDPGGAAPAYLSAGAADQFGDDLIVSLGGFALPDEPGRRETRARWEAGALLHGLGHHFGLEHGGAGGGDANPGYLSAMNSRYELAGIESLDAPGSADSRVDFSWQALGPLDENRLDEAAGLLIPSPASPHARDVARYECPETRSGPAAGPIDWNCNGEADELLEPPAAPVDLNHDHHFGLLEGFDDWSHLALDFQCGDDLGDSSAAGSRRISGEIDFATAVREHRLHPMARPRLAIRGGDVAAFIVLDSPAALPVTLFGSAEFDAATIALSSVRLAGAAPIAMELIDKDGDGHLDLQANFRQAALRLTPASTKVTLTGFLSSSQAFEATVSIRISRTGPSRPGQRQPRPAA